LTAPPPITPTSPRCPSAWQPNPGRRSTYRRGNAVQTTGATSDRPTWDSIVPDTAKAYFGGDAEAACFSPCFAAAIERARKYWPEELMMSLHFDKGRRSPKLNAIIDVVERDYRGAPALINISFNVVEAFTPLQAADIIATENYWHAQGVIGGNPQPRPHFAHFLERVSAEGFIAQEKEIIETLRIHGFVPKIIPSGDER
jgi:hypothetical protein